MLISFHAAQFASFLCFLRALFCILLLVFILLFIYFVLYLLNGRALLSAISFCQCLCVCVCVHIVFQPTKAVLSSNNCMAVYKLHIIIIYTYTFIYYISVCIRLYDIFVLYIIILLLKNEVHSIQFSYKCILDRVKKRTHTHTHSSRFTLR